MVKLLAANDLIVTGPVDQAGWNYRPVLGYIQRLRFDLVSQLLPKHTVPKVLELGYGSGVFMPELASRCEALFGLDVHPYAGAVTSILASRGIKATLSEGTATAMPYEGDYFDVIVAVSCLEFIPNIAEAAQEMRRVLKPHGHLIFVTPGHSAFIDAGLRIMTRGRASEYYGERRHKLMINLSKQFESEATIAFPTAFIPSLTLYTAVKAKPRFDVPDGVPGGPVN